MLTGSMVRKIVHDKLGIRFTDGHTVITGSAYSVLDFWGDGNVPELDSHNFRLAVTKAANNPPVEWWTARLDDTAAIIAAAITGSGNCKIHLLRKIHARGDQRFNSRRVSLPYGRVASDATEVTSAGLYLTSDVARSIANWVVRQINSLPAPPEDLSWSEPGPSEEAVPTASCYSCFANCWAWLIGSRQTVSLLPERDSDEIDLT